NTAVTPDTAEVADSGHDVVACCRPSRRRRRRRRGLGDASVGSKPVAVARDTDVEATPDERQPAPDMLDVGPVDDLKWPAGYDRTGPEVEGVQKAGRADDVEAVRPSCR